MRRQRGNHRSAVFLGKRKNDLSRFAVNQGGEVINKGGGDIEHELHGSDTGLIMNFLLLLQLELYGFFFFIAFVRVWNLVPSTTTFITFFSVL